MVVLICEVTCLVICLCVILAYVESGVHSKTHRLLPLVLGLIDLYHFYSIAQHLFGQAELMGRLTDMLLIQMLYLMCFYVRDFFYQKPIKWYLRVLFVLMIGADIIFFVAPYGSLFYKYIYHVIVNMMLICMFVNTYYFWVKMRFSIKEAITREVLMVAMVFPAIGLLLDTFGKSNEHLVMNFTLTISSLCVYYLLKNNMLLDINSVLRERAFSEGDLPMILFDTDYYFVDANKRAEKLFPEYVNAQVRMSRGKEHIEITKELFEKGPDFEIQKDDKFYNGVVTPVYSGGTLWGYVLGMIDITEQKKKAIHLEKLKNEAQEQTRLKSQFLARMSHDLKSPLHAIIGMSDILLNQSHLPSKERDRVSRISISGKSLLDMVNSILDYSKLEAGKMELAKNEYSFVDMLNSLTDNVIVNLESKPVDFKIIVESNIPEVLVGDELRVREMLQNVFSNAIKFTDQGQIECIINIDVRDDDAFISIKTRDTGCGISPDMLEDIFDEYSSTVDNIKTEGVGLGMSIVAQFTELMGGRAWAQSDGKTGSTICMEFHQGIAGDEFLSPMVFDRTTIESLRVAQRNNARPSYIYPDAKVLIVDDMKINRDVFIDITAGWKFEVDQADSGQAAVEAAKNKKYDLIFLDLMMPGMDGDEAAAIIRQDCDTPLVLFSANTFEDMSENYMAAGFSAFLSKPIDERVLKETIESLMPEHLRNEILKEDKSKQNLNLNKLISRKKILDVFEGEIIAIGMKLKEEYNRDLELFRVRVHGIKGAGRQIGFEDYADKAEIMEMAAKAGHKTFIDKHLEDFIELTKGVLDKVDEERQHIDEDIQLISGNREVDREEIMDLSQLADELAEAFAAFDMDRIEKNVEQMASMEMTDIQERQYYTIKKAADDFEYEIGKELTEEFIKML